MKVLLSALLLLFLVGCSLQVCNAPYISQKGECCLDMNANAICDDTEDITLEDIENSFAYELEQKEVEQEEPKQEMVKQAEEVQEEQDIQEESLEDNAQVDALQEELDALKAELEALKSQEQVPQKPLSDKELLRERAIAFSDALLANNISVVYDLIDPSIQSQMTKEDFVFYFPYVQYGTYEAYADTGEMIYQGLDESDVLTRVVDRVEINETTGYVHYLETDKLKDQYLTTYVFTKTDTWYAIAFADVAIVSCDMAEECFAKNESLYPLCVEACEEKSYVPLGETNEYRCKNHVCECNCYNTYQETTYPVRP